MAIKSGAKFDFELGSLTQSPCKTCKNRDKLPTCMNDCKILAMIQQQLTSAVSCNHELSELDTFTLMLPVQSQV